MSTEFFNDQWRIPTNSNQNKVSNYCMNFDGTSDKIEFGNVNSFERTDSFSGSCWVNLDSISFEFLLTKMPNSSPFRGYLMYIVNGRLQFAFNSNFPSNRIQVNSVGTISTGNWNHLVFTYDGSSLRTGVKLYINGIEQSVTFDGPVSVSGSTINTADFQISGRGTSSRVDGKIDQVSVFDYALSQTQITNLYGDGTSLITPMALSPAPISYYQLGDQSVDNGANYLVPNNSLQDYVFASGGSLSGSINLANPVPLGTSKTVSFWFKLSSSANFSFSPFTDINNPGNCYYPYFINSSSTYKWYLSDRFCGGVGSINIGSGGTAERNKWVHAAVVGNATNVKCYINGIKVNDDSNADRNPTIQKLIYGATQLIEFSNFSIFNTNLPETGTESISSLYNNGTPPDLTSYSNIIHWWKLNAADTFDGTNWTIKDYVGSNDGTSSGMTSANLVQSDLQHVSGFSPYALDFDGVNDFLQVSNAEDLSFGTGDFTISAWIYPKTLETSRLNVVYSHEGTSSPLTRPVYISWFGDDLRFAVSGVASLTKANVITINEWQHICATRESGTVKIFRNGVLGNSATISDATGAASTVVIGKRSTDGFANGNISNVAVWKGSVINPVTLFNSGVPADLSKLNPTAWWQLGSNSSFNTNWTCLNEGSLTSLNAVSAGSMTNDDITNGVGYSANGLGTSSIDIVGDAPYSSGNGLSENMDVLDRVKDTPPS